MRTFKSSSSAYVVPLSFTGKSKKKSESRLIQLMLHRISRKPKKFVKYKFLARLHARATELPVPRNSGCEGDMSDLVSELGSAANLSCR